MEKQQPTNITKYISDVKSKSSASVIPSKEQKQHVSINSPVLAPIGATKYLGVATEKENTDGLKTSRSTGILWGVQAPPFLKCGRKILYRVTDLNDWLNQFEVVTNNAQVGG